MRLRNTPRLFIMLGFSKVIFLIRNILSGFSKQWTTCKNTTMHLKFYFIICTYQSNVYITLSHIFIYLFICIHG